MSAIVWVPGHLCGPWLYAPQIARHPGPVAEVDRDDGIEAMAARLLATAPERFVVVGLSMGGMVAMAAMAAAPERIAGALLMDTDPTPARDREIAWRAGEMATLDAGAAGYVGRFVDKFFAHDPDIAERLGPTVAAHALETPVAVIRAQARALDTRPDLLSRIDGFRAPVEVVVGAEDRICPPKLHGPLAAACADARLTEIPGTGHLASLEAPDAVLAALERLLDRTCP